MFFRAIEKIIMRTPRLSIATNAFRPKDSLATLINSIGLPVDRSVYNFVVNGYYGGKWCNEPLECLLRHAHFKYEYFSPYMCLRARARTYAYTCMRIYIYIYIYIYITNFNAFSRVEFNSETNFHAKKKINKLTMLLFAASLILRDVPISRNFIYRHIIVSFMRT